MEQYLERLEEISKMRDKWTLDKEEGINPPTEKSIIETKRILPIMSQYEINTRFYIYPSMSGGIYIEWSKDNWEASVEILPDGKTYEFLAVNIENRESIDSGKIDLIFNFENDYQSFVNKF